MRVTDWEGEHPIVLAFTTKRSACRHAARQYGFKSYTQAKRKGWCEVRSLKHEG